MSAYTPDSAPAAPNASDPPRIRIDIRRLPGIRRLAADYTTDALALAPFVDGHPADPRAWTEAIARAQAHVRDRAGIVGVLAAQQEQRGAPAAARAAARSLADPHTVAIVTGQQAGLFGGPLFTLLKALTAMRLARHVASTHQTPAVAVFWVDAEDHDWDEVRSCTVLDADLTPRRISLPEVEPPPRPVGQMRLGASITAALDELAVFLSATEFRDELLSALRDTYAPGSGMSQAFSRWLERLLGPYGLVVYDASDLAAKPLARSVFVRETSTPGSTAGLAAQAGADLEAAGYHAQVQPGDQHLSLFFLDGRRLPIRRTDDTWTAGDHHWSSAELVEEAASRPERFSPNVLLRPIVQDTLFPTVCYVAGPNELAYLCQLRRVYQHFGLPMPLLYPRATVTLLDSGAMRFLGKYEVPLEALQAQDDATLNALLAKQMPPEVEGSFRTASAEIEARMRRIIEAVPAVDATLDGAARSTLTRMQHDLETLHGKVVQAAKRRDETLRRQFTRTRALAFPDGKAQERAVAFVWFLNQYGPALVERLQESLPLDLGQHWVLTL